MSWGVTTWVVLVFWDGQRDWAETRKRGWKPAPPTITTSVSVCKHALAQHTAGNVGTIAWHARACLQTEPELVMIGGAGFPPCFRVAAQSLCPFKNARTTKLVTPQLIWIEHLAFETLEVCEQTEDRNRRG